VTEPVPEPASEPQVDDTGGWQRLDPRLLLVDPVRTLGRFAVPFLIAFVGVGSADSSFGVGMLPVFVGVALLFGMLPWLTTHYRVTATQLQVRRGLLQRTTVTAPLDRIRSVDLEASLLRRLLSVTKVQIGTGVDEKRIALDAVSVAKAHELRHSLLAASRAAGPLSSAQPGQGVPAAGEHELARVDWRWLRFAPFSLSRLVIVASALGALSQFADQIPLADAVRSAWDGVSDVSLVLVVAVATVALALGWVVVAVGGYVIQWWDMRLTRGHGHVRLTAGLFTTRATSVEERRLRGVELVEPALLRLVRGAELNALATGVGRGGAVKVLPPAPRTVALRVGGEILETSEPLSVRLLRHGVAARRRSHIRAQRVTLAVALAVVVLSVSFDWSVWAGIVVVPLVAVGAAVAAELRYRQLGHQLTDAHLISGTGALERRRTALERDGIIGWVVAQTWFQRRVGLATLVATTAAGPERVVIHDVPLARALEVADAATPGLLTPFLR
jgi:putative membrane protein